MLRQLFFILITLIIATSASAGHVTLYPAHPGITEAEFEQKLEKEPVNINTAKLEDLAVIKGIGFKKAKSIIEYRDTKGSFKSVADLMKVKGIGPKIFKKIENFLTV